MTIAVLSGLVRPLVEPHLPEARVPAEDRGVATGVGEGVERLPHAT